MTVNPMPANPDRVAVNLTLSTSAPYLVQHLDVH
jgi:hypothetical protein